MTDLANLMVFCSLKENSRTSRPSQSYRTLSEEEVVERFVSIATKKKDKVLARQQKAERKKLRKKEAEEMARQMAEMKMQKKLEQQGRCCFFESKISVHLNLERLLVH